MTVGLLTTNYNTAALTTKCISNCLLYADDKIDQFTVVDDCSTELFENSFKNVRVLRNDQNSGLVKSLNKGLKVTLTDLVILFDSDAWPLENYIVKTKKFFQDHPETGIAAYTTENGNGKATSSFEPEPNAMSVLLGQKLHGYYQKYLIQNPKHITVYTCAMVIRKEVIAQIGGFDENYDWLELDHDICMSAIRKGWDIGIIPVRAYHKGSGTPQKVGNRVIRFYLNRIKLLKKFNKYPAKYLLNSIIVSRLTIEYLLINTVGRVKFSHEVREDKSYSRSKLIRLFFTGKI
jgi:GT2 family glycosyltransferase